LRERFDEKYFKFGMSIFLAGSGTILFYFIMKNIDLVGQAFSKLNSILAPFIIGLIMAYLLCPLYNLVTRKVYHRASKHINKHKAFILAKVMASIVSLIVLLLVMAAIVALLVPQIIKSIVAIVEILPGRMEDLTVWLTDMLKSTKYPQLAGNVDSAIQSAYDYLMKWAGSHIMPGVGSYMAKISEGVLITLRTFLNTIIGIVVCVYFLNGKERFKAEGKKIIISLFRRDRADAIFDFGNFSNKTFGGFINGKIIDSLIIGLICYAFMLIMHWPYPALISTIIGVTNIIPFFGPFIGAIPTSIIICVINPITAGEFIIWIFCLQQFDGNILGPKILGGTTGLASFWVMFSIIFFGGLFGFVGMILGVPVFAIFYYYFKKYVEKRLDLKGWPVSTNDYEDFNKYDINRKDVQK
jgi:predicted PurR-regulated permease PerM